MILRPKNVRNRLTLWYVCVVALVLLLYIFAASVLELWQLHNQLYHAEVQDMETVEGLLYFTPAGDISLDETYHNHPRSLLLLDRLMEVLTPEGRILYRNQRLGNRSLGGKPTPNEGVTSYERRTARLEDGTRVLLISHWHSLHGRPLLIRIAYGTGPLARTLGESVALLLLAMPVALFFAGFVGYRMIGRALRPLGEMVERTEKITAARLDERLHIENPEDELGQLAGVLNGLLQRLENSFTHLERFTSDASHELRTLLASMRSVGEVALQRDQTREQYRDVIGSMLEEVTRLTRMVEALLAIAKAEAGQVELQTSIFPLMDLATEVAALLSVLVEEKGQIVSVQGNSRLLVEADRVILQRAVVNVVENAIKYSPRGSNLYMIVQPAQGETADWIELVIEDEGPGIPEEMRGRVFERFFRFEAPGVREAGGSGLGLAITKWAVVVNGGKITLRSGRTGGCLFSLQLPRARGPI
jgi:heavy metal sensor kinase